ncbi:MAG: glycyl-radical enzyme activating protein, partial [Verrucomicrobia bacterium]
MAQASTATGTSGLVSHIQRYSVQDGPGIRTTVFLKGCPLRCAWCHNPENLAVGPQVMVIETRCVRCGACVEVCSQQPPGQRPAIESLPLRPANDCTVCGACVEACPAGARETVGREMTVGDVLREVLADRIFYDDSGGGVTFSGGEPLNQFEFLRCALEACRQQEVHTAVDTSGFASRERLLEVARFTDL